MWYLPLEQVIEKIQEETGLSREEIERQIKEKLAQLDGLVTEEGAAYIVASELGVRLFKGISSGSILKIKDILIGMQSVDTAGKVLRKFEPISFERDGRKSRVGSVIIADGTSSIRVVFWGDKCALLERIKEGDIIRIKGAYVKQNLYGAKELHIGGRAQIILNPENISFPNVERILKKSIAQLNVGESAKIRGTIVKLYPVRFYQTDEKEEFVLNFVVDDGHGAIRAVAFGDRAERLCGLSCAEIRDLLANSGESAVSEELERRLLGLEVALEGRTVENKEFNRLEFVIFRSWRVSPQEIISELLRGENGEEGD